jgi:ADP-ribosyl-[dinitrogen reductase] hydrolase
MIGALIGDIVGSRFEWNNIKHKDFDFFTKDCFFTDDSVLTIALADSLMSGDDYAELLKDYTRKYPNRCYGGRYIGWAMSDDYKSYNSYGNGSAMRVSPAGWFAKTELETAWLASHSASVTHSHPEGLKGAVAVAYAIFIARSNNIDQNLKKFVIKNTIQKNCGYDLNRKLDDIRETYQFNETCQKTVPESIIAFLESDSFDDAIRNAISIGGDSDTVACITGSIADAYYTGQAMQHYDTMIEYFSEYPELVDMINLFLEHHYD